MTQRSFAKVLSANDVGVTGSHQAGILVPKADPELLSFFPALDPSVHNPDAWITCTDESGNEWKLRYVYYNNRFHSEAGTRNEYRLTYLTPYFRRTAARPGEQLVFIATSTPGRYLITIRRDQNRQVAGAGQPGVITLRGWRRIH